MVVFLKDPHPTHQSVLYKYFSDYSISEFLIQLRHDPSPVWSGPSLIPRPWLGSNKTLGTVSQSMLNHANYYICMLAYMIQSSDLTENMAS